MYTISTKETKETYKKKVPIRICLDIAESVYKQLKITARTKKRPYNATHYYTIL